MASPASSIAAAPPAHRRLPRLAAAAGLGGVGLLLNLQPVPLVPSVELLLGPLLVLLAAALCGPRGGALAGALAGLPTLWLWSHPLGWGVALLEGGVVGALARRVRPAWADLLFWAVGLPLLTVCWRLLGLPWPDALTLGLKATLNSLLAVLAVQVLLLLPPVRRRLAPWLPLPLREVSLAERVGSLLVLGLVLPLMLVGVAEGRQRHRVEQQRLEARTLALARLGAETVQAVLENALSASATFAAGLSEGLEREGTLAPPEALERRLERWVRLGHMLRAGYVADAEGRPLALTPPPAPGMLRLPFVEREDFLRLRQGGRPVLSHVVQGPPPSRGPQVEALAPVVGPEGLVGVVGLGVDVGRLRALLSQHMEGNERWLVVDPAGRVLLDTAPPSPASREGATLEGTALGGVLAHAGARQVGQYEEVPSGPSPVQQRAAAHTYALETVEGLGWRVVVESPLGQLDRAVLSTYGTLLGSLALALLVLLAATPLLARLISAPVEAVAQAAERLAAGDRTSRTSLTEALDTRETRHLAETFDRMAQQLSHQLEALERAAKEKDHFLTVASHELKTPLTTLQLHVQRLYKQLPQREGQTLATLQRQVERLTRLVNQMLDVSQMESGQLHMTLRSLRLDEVVARAAHARMEPARTHQLQLVLAPVRVQGDALRLEQLVHNLLDNAVRFSPEGGPVEVRLVAEGGRAVLTVEDRGVGLTDKVREDTRAAFTRYTPRSQPSVASVAGLGVGLHYCREVALRHGGSMRLESREGGGARAVLVLPQQPEAGEAVA